MKSYVQVETVTVNGVDGFFQPALVRSPEQPCGPLRIELLGDEPPTNAFGSARVRAMEHATRLGVPYVEDD